MLAHTGVPTAVKGKDLDFLDLDFFFFKQERGPMLKKRPKMRSSAAPADLKQQVLNSLWQIPSFVQHVVTSKIN